MSTVLAWHFVGDALRDGRPVPADGELLVHTGELRIFHSGLHASTEAINALKYAPGAVACRVECGGQIERGGDKLVCTERRILWRVDATDLLRKFARECAADVLHLWDAPEVVREYLTTGDESLRDAAQDAAWAAQDAAQAAPQDAAWAAARAVAWAAARAAPQDAARAVAQDVAWAAAQAVAQDVAWAAQDVAWAAQDVAWAAQDAAWAAQDAAQAGQNNRLTKMLMEAGDKA